MGRFETTVDFYAYREPYPPEFFAAIAARLPITRQTRLLDVGCGPGPLVIGFSRFAGSATAIDIEPAMLKAARAAASQAGADVTFIETPIEDFACPDGSFDLVAIGRALHWFVRDSTLRVFERIVAPHGRIVLCGSAATDVPSNEWVKKFRAIRTAWAPDFDMSSHRPDLDRWFAGSRFQRLDEIRVEHRHRLSIPGLLRRAVSFSVSSPAMLGERQHLFEAEIEAAVAPFARDGALDEELAVTASVFGQSA